VLLVDADMRRPRLSSVFGISSKEGFATVMSGESLWKDVIFECEEIEGLSIMPCGAKPSNPAELSTSPQLKMLIAQLREHFDYVIIDTPPILAVTDPCPIAARVDGVVLAIRIKKNVRTSAERSVEILRNLGANIVGVVVNGVGAQTGYGSQYTYSAYRSGYAYNEYGYGYGYGYGNHYTDDTKGTVRQKTPRLVAAAASDNASNRTKNNGSGDLDIED
jgi:capsular exopolysaccharide synthesis family protein